MKLNPDCIRDILLSVEDSTDLSTPFRYPVEPIGERLVSYSHGEVVYHIKQCELSGMLSKVRWTDDRSGCIVFYLSPAGHEFLSNIRNDTNWNKTKEVAKSVGSFSLDALTKVATSVIASAISAQFK